MLSYLYLYKKKSIRNIKARLTRQQTQHSKKNFFHSNRLCSNINVFSTIRVVFDAKTPLRRRQSLLQYTLRPRNAKRSSRISDSLHRRQRIQPDQPMILPERDTNPEWEALLDRLDVASEEADQTALIAEAIRTIYPYERRKMRALIFDRRDVILIAKTSFEKVLH